MRRRSGTRPGSAWALPLCLLLAGLPLAFLATGLRFMPICARRRCNIPGRRVLAGGPDQEARLAASRHHDDDEDDDHEYEDDDEGAYHLDDDDEHRRRRPEPIAATRLAERQKSRVKREDAKRAPSPSARTSRPALNLASGEYQLPALELAGRAAAGQGHPRACPTRRWKKMPACWKRCWPISASRAASPPCAPARW